MYLTKVSENSYRNCWDKSQATHVWDPLVKCDGMGCVKGKVKLLFQWVDCDKCGGTGLLGGRVEAIRPATIGDLIDGVPITVGKSFTLDTKLKEEPPPTTYIGFLKDVESIFPLEITSNGGLPKKFETFDELLLEWLPFVQFWWSKHQFNIHNPGYYIEGRLFGKYDVVDVKITGSGSPKQTVEYLKKIAEFKWTKEVTNQVLTYMFPPRETQTQEQDH